jgi:hypothetical protein
MGLSKPGEMVSKMNKKEMNIIMKALKEATYVLNDLTGGANLVSIDDAMNVMIKKMRKNEKKKTKTEKK